ncbi:MAG: DUF1501 domain-containing protein [Verrucomicrobiota bacterium]|mgnify:CR=1 FL=1|nr:DUF1501 domain-containing protein [Verrucomicrobiota bacterium]MEC7639152.1 DUF1501 domain-containing protein [Verrucomicrobiota bacterium]MEC7856347.1 DUF1501 domain-containing protein [Verrucomicrobiota bacterium]MEC8659543.1 DUF1501 domain-containing protein [Verrucomicrobiota bacterium]
MSDSSIFNKGDEVSRRQFMIGAARNCLGVSVLPMLGSTIATNDTFAAAPPMRRGAAKSVIFLNMAGGMSHLDTFDPKPDNQDVQGPTPVIDTNADNVRISGYLPKTASVMKHITLFRGMQTNQGAHEQGQYLLHRSYPMRGTIVHPALGAWVMRLSGRRNTTIPGFVSIGGSSENATGGFMGAKYGGVPLGSANDGLKDSKRAHSVSESDFTRRLELADKMNSTFHGKFKQKQIKTYHGLYDEAIKLMTSEDLKAFDLKHEDVKVRDMYGQNGFGQGCLLARRLVEHHVRFVEVSMGGWDTHNDNFVSVESRCQILDSALAGLISDLERRGLLDSTLVALGTEFGRTPEINENTGRDHFPRAFTSLMAGGGVKGGFVYGETDRKAHTVKEGVVTPGMFNATIGHALGLPTERVVTSPSGRPFTIGDEAKPVKEVFA